MTQPSSMRFLRLAASALTAIAMLAFGANGARAADADKPVRVGIIGTGKIGGIEHSFLLTPAAVPEPLETLSEQLELADA